MIQDTSKVRGQFDGKTKCLSVALLTQLLLVRDLLNDTDNDCVTLDFTDLNFS